jgi:aspartate/methionine/tyrosine aminotransferase
MQCVPVDAVQIVTGASEALVALMWLAAEPGANVIIPLPGFTTFSALPESLGLETRFYRVRRESGFRIDPDEIKRLTDSKTKLILVNSPHNPTGATIGDGEMEALHDFMDIKRGTHVIKCPPLSRVFPSPCARWSATNRATNVDGNNCPNTASRLARLRASG